MNDRTKDENININDATDIIKLKEERNRIENWYKKQIDIIMHSYPDALGSLLMNLTKDFVSSQRRLYTFIQEQQDQSIEDYLLKMKEAIPEEDFQQYETLLSRQNLIDAYHSGKTEFDFIHRYKFIDKMRWIKSIVRIIENPITDDIETYVSAIDVTEQILSELVMEKLVKTRYDIIALIYIEEGRVDFRYSGNEFENIPEITIDQYEKNRIAAASIFGVEQSEKYIRCTDMDVIQKSLDDTGQYFFTMKYETEGHLLYKRYSYNYLSDKKDIILSTVQDVTSIQQKDEAQLKVIQDALADAERANLAKAAFLSNMSHDIRTPMNAIINMTKMAMEDLSDSDKTANDLKKIETSSEFLLSLINDVLDMSRIDSGKMQFHPEVYEYQEFVSYIESVFGPLCANKDIQFIWEKATESIPMYVDKLRFNQMFFNLFSNAVKYTPAGGRIEFIEENVKKEDGYIESDFIIKDNGQGMSEEFQKRMFEPFEREEGRVQNQPGTGLGLAIVKNTLDLLGGTIQVKSRIGEGSAFMIHVRIPCATKEQIEKKKKQLKYSMQVSLEGKHILVAEDHPLNREIMDRLLKKRGMVPEFAENGEECLQLFRKSKEYYFDAVLMDVRMPVLNGLEATKRIRVLPGLYAKNIPIIAMTANAFAEDKSSAEEAGMTGYLAKPVDTQKMYEILAEQVYAKGNQEFC